MAFPLLLGGVGIVSALVGTLVAWASTFAFRVLFAIGFSVVLFTGLTALSTTVLDLVTANLSGLPAFALQSLNMSGLLTILSSSLAAYIAGLVTRRLLLTRAPAV